MLIFYYNILVINCFYDHIILYSYPEVVYRYLCGSAYAYSLNKLQNYKFSTPKKMVFIANKLFFFFVDRYIFATFSLTLSR